MRVLLLAAGAQERWNASGGDGLKQLVTAAGEPVIRRAYRLATAHPAVDDVLTIVRDTRARAWRGLRPRKAQPEPWMGEMGKFLDARPHWPAQGGVAILYGDAYYTEEALDRILGHEPTQPTVYGRSDGVRRLESFGFRFDVAEADEVERVARACADAGMNAKGGPWRWFHMRHHPNLTKYAWTRVRDAATEANGWVEIPSDATDDFDKLADLEAWRARWRIRP